MWETSEEETSDESEIRPKKCEEFEKVQLKTVVFDNSKEYEKRMEIVKETARLCIQNYKVIF